MGQSGLTRQRQGFLSYQQAEKLDGLVYNCTHSDSLTSGAMSLYPVNLRKSSHSN